MWDVTYTIHTRIKQKNRNFYSHIPCGMWPSSSAMFPICSNFYSHIPCGMWLFSIVSDNVSIPDFYSHIPCGMWRISDWWIFDVKIFLLTHPVWDVTVFCVYKMRILQYFYSHIPCGMWRFTQSRGFFIIKFLLTHPVWDVTTIYHTKNVLR